MKSMKYKLSDDSDTKIKFHISDDIYLPALQTILKELTNQTEDLKVTYDKPKPNPFCGMDWSGWCEFQVLPTRWGIIDNVWYNHAKHTALIQKKFGKIANKSVWYPEKPPELTTTKTWKCDKPVKQTQYPIYIISKGRHEDKARHTSKEMERLGLDYKIVVEDQEYEDYNKTIHESKIIKMPKKICNMGQGGIPARNYCWKLAKQSGVKRFWLLDDNIKKFYRLNRNQRVQMDTPMFFNMVEDYADRYINFPLMGLNYYNRKNNLDKKHVIAHLNRHVYSCLLIQTDIPIIDNNFHGKYNEDVDLCIRILKSNQPTLDINSFLINKTATTSKPKGGNFEIYSGEGQKEKAHSLVAEHGDCYKPTYKKKKWHFDVNWDKINKNVKYHLKPDWVVKQYDEMKLC